MGRLSTTECTYLLTWKDGQKYPERVSANDLVECGLLMFHFGAPALSLLSVSAHTRQSPPYSLVPN